jgi:hypothetical protein
MLNSAASGSVFSNATPVARGESSSNSGGACGVRAQPSSAATAACLTS